MMRLIGASAFMKVGDHAVCEDYAVAGTSGGIDYAVVSDGCSTGRRSDVAARVLALLAERAVKQLSLGLAVEALSVDALVDYLRENIRHGYHCHRLGDLVPIDELLATLVITLVLRDRDLARTVIFGDGLLLARLDDRAWVFSVDYADNAPCYLAYSLDSRLEREYEASFDGKPQVRIFSAAHPGGRLVTEKDDPSPKATVIDISLQGYKRASLIASSDGLASIRPERGLFEVASQLTDNPSLAGDFIQRRARAFFADEAASHRDDIGLAGLSLQEDTL